MRLSHVLAILLIGGLALSAPTAAQPQLPAPSQWTNELGSVMTIDSVDSTGFVTGSYVTAAGCGQGVQKPLVGWYNGGAFTFTVDWQECDSLTVWSGNLDSTGQTIPTLWHLVISGTPQWNSTLAGTDTFTRQN